MGEIKGHIIEEFGLKAYKDGFFNEWISKTSSISQDEEIPLHEIAEKVYNELKSSIKDG